MSISTVAGVTYPKDLSAHAQEHVSMGGVGDLRPQIVGVLDLTASGALRSVTFPSPYSAGGDATLNAMTQAQRDYMAHPSVVLVPNGWNGYKYWATATPYPGANSAYENPCIYASNDAETWVVPTGLTNPVVGKPADGYNADGTLFFSADGLELYLVYRQRLGGGATPGNSLMLMRSANGYSWSSPESILFGTYNSQDYASPSLNWNGSRWELISHNLDNAGTRPVELRVSTTASLTGGFDAPVTLSTQSPRGVTWWHSDFRLTPDGYIGIMQDGDSAGGALFFAESTSKTNIAAVYALASPLYYRSALCLDSRDGGVLTVFVGRANQFTISQQGYQRGRATLLASELAVEYSIFGTAQRLVAKDSFTRADDATSAGSPEIGPAYTVGTGTWGISTNRLYGVTTGSNRLTTETGSTSHEIVAKLETAGTQWWVLAGFIDANNFIRVGTTGGTSQLQVIKAGAVFMSEAFSSIVAGSVVRVRKLGSRVQVSVDGNIRFDARIDSIGLGTSVGFQTSGAALSYFDNLAVMNMG